MSAPRLATIPFEHIEAELAAFPIASETSFHLGTKALNPLVSQDDLLWRAAEEEVVGALPSLPLDEAAAIRDKLWFGKSKSLERSNQGNNEYESISLVRYVRRLAEYYLDSEGKPVELSGSEGEPRFEAGPEGRLRWSWMCQAFPPDLLRVARGVVDPERNHITLSPTVERLLYDSGFAETHLHLGAALDFSLAWAALMSSLSKNSSNHDAFESPGACFHDGRDLYIWIVHAAVARLILAESLFHSSSAAASLDNMLRFTCDHLVPLDAVERYRLTCILRNLLLGRWHESNERELAVRQQHLAKRFAQTRATCHRLVRSPNLFTCSIIPSTSPENRCDIFAQDPIALVVGWTRKDGVSPETLFIEAALSRMENDEKGGKKDTDFSRLFWQVMRVRCLLYRHVVQRPMTPGLQWFVRFFSRIKPLRNNLSSAVRASTAARITGEGLGLRSLELRLGTEESESACLALVRSLEGAALPEPRPPIFRFFRPDRIDSENTSDLAAEARFEVGGLFHFSRKRGGGWEHGRPNAFGLDHSFPGLPPNRSKPLKNAGNPTGFRFARFYMEQRRHAQALVSLFMKYPLALRTIRGLDLCTDEAGVPVWVMAPLMRWVRKAGEQAAIHLKRRSELEIPPMRTSVHAGEDFVHLLAGLRRIDNTITYLDLKEGDRLGHALALGIDPERWCFNTGRVVQTHEERLFDLIWEWGCYAKHNVDVTPTRLAYVESEIIRLARSIFKGKQGLSLRPEALTAFWDLLHTDEALRDAGFPDRSGLGLRRERDQQSYLASDTPQGQRTLETYLCDKQTWLRGRTLETLDLRNLKHESAALFELQKGLHRRIGKQCLTIEVNPSSNLLIADLIDLKNHPLWRIRPVSSVREVCPISICVGSDNPLTFATTLPHEYQLLFDAIVLGDQSHEVAVKWVDEVRESSMRARFTLPREVARLSQELSVPNLLRMQRPLSPP